MGEIFEPGEDRGGGVDIELFVRRYVDVKGGRAFLYRIRDILEQHTPVPIWVRDGKNCELVQVAEEFAHVRTCHG